METPQQNLLTSLRTTIGVLDDNRSVWASHVAFKAAYDGLLGHATSLTALAAVQKSARAGTTLNKQTIQDLMIEGTLDVAGALRSYANAKKDPELQAFATIHRTDLSTMRDAEMDGRALEIHDKAKAILDDQTAHPPAAGEPKITDHGVTLAMLLVLSNQIAAYAAVVESPRKATVKITTATQAIAAHLAAANELRDEQLTGLARQFRSSHPDFFNAYIASLVIVDAPASHAAPKPDAPAAPAPGAPPK